MPTPAQAGAPHQLPLLREQEVLGQARLLRLRLPLPLLQAVLAVQGLDGSGQRTAAAASGYGRPSGPGGGWGLPPRPGLVLRTRSPWFSDSEQQTRDDTMAPWGGPGRAGLTQV